jgi:6-pyruvoyltetrahydropterin/6-carboxytetrahydropterin synthase
MNAVTAKHNFETAHRLPHLLGKCVSLHGHSWWVEVTVAGPLRPSGVLVEFGTLKTRLRNWVDTYLDHATMLGQDDPLVRPLLEQGCKVFPFGRDLADGLAWPTVENVARLLARVTDDVLAYLDEPGVHVAAVTVRETHVNAATYYPTGTIHGTS